MSHKTFFLNDGANKIMSSESQLTHSFCHVTVINMPAAAVSVSGYTTFPMKIDSSSLVFMCAVCDGAWVGGGRR